MKDYYDKSRMEAVIKRVTPYLTGVKKEDLMYLIYWARFNSRKTSDD